jgi:hypothetical protein
MSDTGPGSLLLTGLRRVPEGMTRARPRTLPALAPVPRRTPSSETAICADASVGSASSTALSPTA